MDRFLLVYGQLYYRFVGSTVTDGSHYLAAGQSGPFGLSMEIAKLALARGFGVFLTGAVGDDEHGRQIIARLNRDGISTMFIVVGGVTRTSVMFQIGDDCSNAWCIRDAGDDAVFSSPNIEDYQHLCDGVVCVVEGADTAHQRISESMTSTEVPEYRVEVPEPVGTLSQPCRYTARRIWRGEERLIEPDGSILELMESLLLAMANGASVAPMIQ